MQNMRTKEFTLILLASACLMQSLTTTTGNSCSASVDEPGVQPIEIMYKGCKILTVNIPLEPGKKSSEQPLVGRIVTQRGPDNRLVRRVVVQIPTTTGH